MSHLITKEGLEDLKKELVNLLENLIPEGLVSLEKAKEAGDLRENSALDAARDDLDRFERRKAEIEEILADYSIIDESTIDKNKVQVGNTIKVKYLNDNEVFEVKIVGSSEASILDYRISNESPLARSLMGKKVGQKASFRLKKGQVDVELLEIK